MPMTLVVQGLLPRNLDIDGRVSMTNLNGTLKARAESSVRVLVLRPGGGGSSNPTVLGWVHSPPPSPLKSWQCSA